ncbi:methylmalonyl-CoA mutase family protein [Streptomyces avermitilis]|uniref:methylmalonyl-CoA mutase family protein n=1 Tax=Streptomyces avermitilis TaxID=33903 RepID=UPI0034103275
MTSYSTAADANARFRRLVGSGARAVPVVFDLPTRAGLDSDAPAARGLVGRRGVAVDSIDDMRVLFGGLRLDQVVPSLAVDAPAAPLLVLYQLVAEEHGAPARRLAGAVRGDVFKEFLARGPGVFPLRPSLRLAMNVFAYCQAELPRWQCLTVCGHHLAGTGADPALEVAFTVSGGIEYLRAAVTAGLDVRTVVPRLTLCLVGGTTDRENRAKLRAARRVWTRTANDHFGSGRTAPRLYVRTPRDGLATLACTEDIEAGATALVDRIERLGGTLTVLEHGLAGQLLGRPHGDRAAAPRPHPAHQDSLDLQARQTERLAKLRAWRVQPTVDEALLRLRKAAQGDDNVLYPMREALAARATVGEVCDALRSTWGTGPRAT